MRKGHGKRLALYALSGILCFIFLLLLFGFNVQAPQSKYRVLSDAALMPGVFLIAAGVLSHIERSGIFDIFGYTFSRMRLVFSPFRYANETYWEFKEKRRRKRHAVSFEPFIIGSLFLLISTVFTILFYGA